MKLPITIAYLSVADPRDRRSWSGTAYHLLRALEQRVQRVQVVGPLRPQPQWFVGQAVNQVLLHTVGKRFNYRDSMLMAKAYAQMAGHQVQDVDLVVAPAGLATTALLQCQAPIIYINDRTIAGALGYHKVLSGLTAWSARESLALERRALGRASLSVFSSAWAADAARTALPAAAEKVRVIPFGANLEALPPVPVGRDFPPERIKLLLLGVNWDDKGGPIAYAALQELKRRGHKATLVVCGCIPPVSFDDPDLVREGFLDKNDPGQRARLEEHLRTADFLVLPTRFEAYGIVFCEAAAHGLPVLATRTGGVPSVVMDGVTGHLFEPTEDGTAYAECILRMVAEPARWQAMRGAARRRAEEVLNWDAFTESLLREAQGAGLISKAR